MIASCMYRHEWIFMIIGCVCIYEWMDEWFAAGHSRWEGHNHCRFGGDLVLVTTVLRLFSLLYINTYMHRACLSTSQMHCSFLKQLPYSREISQTGTPQSPIWRSDLQITFNTYIHICIHTYIHAYTQYYIHHPLTQLSCRCKLSRPARTRTPPYCSCKP